MTKRQKALDVLYQSDNNYAVVTGVSIVSLFENNQHIEQLNVHLIDGGITQKNLQNILKIGKKYGRNISIIDGKKIEKRLIELNCRPYKGSYVTYYKLLAFDQIKTKEDRILMLDGDIIVSQSLEELCDLDLESCVMAETVDAYMPKYLTRQIGLPKGQPYYNAGVMLINQKVWRREDCEKKIINHWKNEKNDYLFADQDITNVLFGDKIKELDIKYNFYSKNYMLHPYERLLMRLDKDMLKNVNINGAVCIHCIDESWRSRPWFRGNSHTMSREWDRYLSMSPWKDWKKLDTNLNTYHRIDRALYHILPRSLYAIALKVVSDTFARLSISRRMLDSKKMHVRD